VCQNRTPVGLHPVNINGSVDVSKGTKMIWFHRRHFIKCNEAPNSGAHILRIISSRTMVWSLPSLDKKLSHPW
jgi:hypothetical protein